MIKLPPEPADPGSFNMTPMIDCVFQLIIFFMLVSDISTKHVEPLVLPVADRSVTVEPREEDELIVNVRADGAVSIGGVAIPDAPALEAFFARRRLDPRFQRTPGGDTVKYPVLIRADRSANWLDIQRVLQIANARGGVVRVALGARKPD